MGEVVVLGGYGHLGRLCVRELAQRTRARLLIAGRSVQRAEELALVFGDRARGTYCNASDVRTLRQTLEGANAVVACCGGDLGPAITVAVSLRVPFVGLSALALAARSRDVLGEAAWKAQVPVVLQAGALPGLPGVLAEVLVRRYRSIRELRIASSGPWHETETAENDTRRTRALVAETNLKRQSLLPVRWRFPEPVGWRLLRNAESSDLHGFADAHCVEHLLYMEPHRGPLARGLERIGARPISGPFALSAEARLDSLRSNPEASIDITCSDAPSAAAAVAASLVSAILAGEAPAGLLTPRETMNPARILRDLEKAGARVLSSTA